MGKNIQQELLIVSGKTRNHTELKCSEQSIITHSLLCLLSIIDFCIHHGCEKLDEPRELRMRNKNISNFVDPSNDWVIVDGGMLFKHLLCGNAPVQLKALHLLLYAKSSSSLFLQE